MGAFQRIAFCLISLMVAVPAFAENSVVRFVIVNHGEDVGDKGRYFIYPVGERKKDLGYAYSGARAKVPEGSYDVLVRYQDGGVKKEVWMESKNLSGDVDETVEMNVKLARVKFTLTNNGVTIGNKGRFLLYPPGEKDKEISDEASDSTATVAAGAYDVLLKFKDGSVKKEMWLKNQKFDGDAERTVDVSVNLAEVVVHVTRLGQPSKIAWCGIYVPNSRDEPVAKGRSDETFQVAEGVYDVGCFYNDAGIETEQWLKNQSVKDKTEFKMAFDFQRSTLRILPSLEVTIAAILIYPSGDRKRMAAKGGLGDRLLMASGTYDIVMKVDKRQVVWMGIYLEGEVVVPFGDKAPSKSLKNVTIKNPEPGPLPVMPQAQEPSPSPAKPHVVEPVVPPSEPEPSVEEPEAPTGPEVVVTSMGPPPQTLPPWAVKPTKKKWLGGCELNPSL